jgi:predicted amidohydrolase
VLAGSHAEASGDPERPFNTAVLIDRRGEIAATYRKLHLFDVAVDDGPTDRESARVTAGDQAVVADMDGTGLGMSICYDLRFPELYRALSLAGAEVLAVPAVFTERTGRDHWEVLLRARAIENGAWVVAAGGCGRGGRGAIPAWGHSMIVDPWGRVVAEAGPDEAIVRAELDTEAVVAARRQIPALANRRPDALPPSRAVDVIAGGGAR